MENHGHSSSGTAIVGMLLEFRGTAIQEYCREKVRSGADPFAIFAELQGGLEEIGRGYEDREFRKYFNSDLIVSGRNMKRAIEVLKPLLPPSEGRNGHVVIGTVAGDVHDIGKTIFAVTLESGGIRVTDLGTDVSCSRFVDTVRDIHPDVLAMSALLTTTRSAMGEVIQALGEEGLRQDVRVIVGGHAVSREFADSIGADAYARDCVEGLRVCREFLRNKG